MTMIASINIPVRLPGCNEYIEAMNSSRYKGNKLKRESQDAVLWFIKGIPRITEPVIVTFRWYENERRRDKDNVAFAKKFILDALQEGGVLPNDNNRHIVGFEDYFIYGQGYGVTVELKRPTEGENR